MASLTIARPRRPAQKEARPAGSSASKVTAKAATACPQTEDDRRSSASGLDRTPGRWRERRRSEGRLWGKGIGYGFKPLDREAIGKAKLTSAPGERTRYMGSEPPRPCQVWVLSWSGRVELLSPPCHGRLGDPTTVNEDVSHFLPGGNEKTWSMTHTMRFIWPPQ